MKKRLILMLTVALLCVASLFTVSMVSAEESTIISAEYSGGATYEYAEEGGVFYATGIAHAAMIGFNFKDGMILNETEHTYVHMKGIVSENVSRIKLNGVYLVNMDSTSRGAVTFDENGVFEYHAELTASGPEGAYFAYDGATKFQFQMYVDGGSTATLNMLGVVFNNSETYDGFADPYTPGEHTHDWATELSHNATTHWYACLNGCEEKSEEAEHVFVGGVCECGREAPGEMTISDIAVPESSDTYTFAVEKDASGNQTVSYSGAIGYSYYSVTINNLEADKTSLNIVFENQEAVTLFYKVNGAENWNIGYVTYNAGQNAQAVPVSADAEGNVVVEFLLDAGVTVEATKSVVFTYIGFEAPAIERPAIEDIVTKSSATIEKDEVTGYQTIKYSTTPGWNDFDIVINEFDSTKTYLKLVFSNENSSAINLFYIINGVENHDIGWKAYGEGENVEYISLAGAQLTTPWTFSFFLDSNETITEEKVVVIKAIEFVTEEDLPKEPEGLHVVPATDGGITCVNNADGGWNLTWNNDTASWRNVSFAVKNYETAYDVIVIKLNATQGTNIGIRVNYSIEADGEVITTYAEVRNHYKPEGIVAETGNLELAYLLKAYGIQGQNITAITIYFDNPTGTSTNVGDQSATIHSVEFLKSSEITFEDLTITAPEAVVDFNGEPAHLAVSSDPSVDLIVEYGIADAEGNISYTTSAPSTAGEYQVRITFMGSLKHDYKVVYSKLTINKIQAVLGEDALVIDPETRVITLADGVVASTDPDFTEGFEILSGATINYGTKIYYKRAGDDNYIESAVAEYTFTRPVAPDSSSPVVDSSSPATSDKPAEPSKPEKESCFGSIGTGSALMMALAGIAVVFFRKRR